MIQDYFQKEIERLGKALQSAISRFTGINPDIDLIEIDAYIQSSGKLSELYSETDIDTFRDLNNQLILDATTKLNLIEFFYGMYLHGDIQRRELNKQKCLTILENTDTISLKTMQIKEKLEKN